MNESFEPLMFSLLGNAPKTLQVTMEKFEIRGITKAGKPAVICKNTVVVP